MALTDYSIDTSGSPQDVQRKQALADALMKQGSDTSPAAGGKWGGALTALNRGLAGALGGYQAGEAKQEEQQGRESARQQLANGLMGADGKINPQAYLQAASNPWVNPQQIGAVGKVQDWQHQTDQDAEHKREFGITSGFQANADRRAAAAEARAAADDDATPVQYVPNPRAGEPGQPAYIDQYAQAAAAAKAKEAGGIKVLGKGGELYHVGEDGKPVIDHRNVDPEGDPMTDGAVDFAASRAIAGDPKALTNLGRGNQGRIDLVKINNKIAEKMKEDPNGARTILDNVAKQAGLVSSSRALGTKETHFGVAEKAMEESLPLAQAASDAVPRSEWLTVNKLVQAGQTEHANPTLKRFLIATDTAAKDYARTINPTGALRESDIEYARKILSTADGPEAYTAALDQLHMEAGVMHRAIQRQKDEMHGKPSASPAPVQAQPKAVDPVEEEMRKRGLLK